MIEKTEVSLGINGSALFEYWTYVVPRIGERMDIDHDEEEVNGIFLVEDVTHRVFQNKKGDTHSYVSVSLKEKD